MMCIPEETFLVVAYKYNYGDNDTDEPGDTYAENTYNNENQELGYASFSDYMMVAVAQTGMYIMPVKMQHWVYKKFLRK